MKLKCVHYFCNYINILFQNVEADPGSSSESSIEFIHDEIVHYERNNNHRSSLQPEVQEDSEGIVFVKILIFAIFSEVYGCYISV